MTDHPTTGNETMELCHLVLTAADRAKSSYMHGSHNVSIRWEDYEEMKRLARVAMEKEKREAEAWEGK